MLTFMHRPTHEKSVSQPLETHNKHLHLLSPSQLNIMVSLELQLRTLNSFSCQFLQVVNTM